MVFLTTGFVVPASSRADPGSGVPELKAHERISRILDIVNGRSKVAVQVSMWGHTKQAKSTISSWRNLDRLRPGVGGAVGRRTQVQKAASTGRKKATCSFVECLPNAVYCKQTLLTFLMNYAVKIQMWLVWLQVKSLGSFRQNASSVLLCNLHLFVVAAAARW